MHFFAIGKIRKFHGDERQAIIMIGDRPFHFNIGNVQEWKHLIDKADHGMFRFNPQDQFAYFIPMTEVSTMLTQAYEQAQLAKEARKAAELGAVMQTKSG